MSRTALVMAGGTGGHIFPGLAVAEALRERSWRVQWLGAPGSMESQLVPPRGLPSRACASVDGFWPASRASWMPSRSCQTWSMRARAQ